MAVTFDYKVRDQSGQLIEGKLEGDSLPLVVGRLREMGYLPIAVTPAKGDGLKTEIVIPGITDRIKDEEIALFTRQFATMVESGLSISRSLGVLLGQMKNKYFAEKISQVRSDVESGAPLSQSLAKFPKQFDTLYIAMIRAGEVGGSIDQVLKSLAQQLERSVVLRRKIKSAMTYPIIVVSVIGIIVLAMMLLIVPVFKNLFKSLGGKLPAPTQALITISNTLASWRLLLVIAIVVIGVVAFKQWLKTPSGRLTWDKFKLKPPIFGPLAHKAARSRFSSTLSSLLSAGVPVMEALDIVSEGSGNAALSEAVQQIKAAVREGQPFAAPMRLNPFFPALVVQMVEVGEQTGALDEMLQRLAIMYNDEVEQTADNLATILEPILIVLMGAVVCGIVICLYLPMFDYIKLVH